MSSSDRQPLLPTHSSSKSTSKPHINHSSSSRLSTTRISFPSSSTSALGSTEDDDEETVISSSPNRQKGKQRSWEGSPLTRNEGDRKPGLPKLSRQCLISEIKCYGSYMLPPLLIFGVLAIGIALLIYGIRNGWFHKGA
ncbi:uncharacterized protein L201_002865 [Kwoniella dendrophila CBS 6074]|uniref:Uncharacterized protein n=1 Tax=Kwoniella dendrophila CBS 6074 TaxID=1295534 RepID=A0AAX4JST4_9TREE